MNMNLKKNPEVDLEKKKSVFFQVGLVTALAVVLLALEWTVYERSLSSLGDLQIELEEEEMIPITQQEITPPPPPPPQAVVLEIVDDEEEIEDVDIESSETDENQVVEIIEMAEEAVIEEPQIFTIVEEMPSMKGCEKAKDEQERTQCTYMKIQEYLRENVKYPQMAIDAGIKGSVYVNFVVMEDGSITDVKVLRGIGGGCDEEAIRVVKKMPKWNAGKQRGKAVRVSYNMPIKFSLK
jgi:periplasmic protein TonB